MKKDVESSEPGKTRRAPPMQAFTLLRREFALKNLSLTFFARYDILFPKFVGNVEINNVDIGLRKGTPSFLKPSSFAIRRTEK